MPRKANPKNEYQREATERTRRKMATVGRPEADYVDAAISAAVYMYFDGVKTAGSNRMVLNFLQGAAEEVLATWPGKSFDRAEIERKVYARLWQRTASDRARFLSAAKSVAASVKQTSKTATPPITSSSRNKNIDFHAVNRPLDGLSASPNYDPTDDDPF